MNKKLLADWLDKYKETHGLNISSLAQRIGTTHQGLRKWLQQEVDAISPNGLRKLSAFRGERPQDTCQWLGIPVPYEFLEKGAGAQRIAEIQDEVQELRSMVLAMSEYLQRLYIRPSKVACTLQDALFESGYDLRDKKEHDRFIVLATKALGGNPVCAQKVALQIIGIVDIGTNDIGPVAQAMRDATGPEWTATKLRELIQQDRKTPKRSAAHGPI